VKQSELAVAVRRWLNGTAEVLLQFFFKPADVWLVVRNQARLEAGSELALDLFQFRHERPDDVDLHGAILSGH